MCQLGPLRLSLSLSPWELRNPRCANDFQCVWGGPTSEALTTSFSLIAFSGRLLTRLHWCQGVPNCCILFSKKDSVHVYITFGPMRQWWLEKRAATQITPLRESIRCQSSCNCSLVSSCSDKKTALWSPNRNDAAKLRGQFMQRIRSENGRPDRNGVKNAVARQVLRNTRVWALESKCCSLLKQNRFPKMHVVNKSKSKSASGNWQKSSAGGYILFYQNMLWSI